MQEVSHFARVILTHPSPAESHVPGRPMRKSLTLWLNQRVLEASPDYVPPAPDEPIRDLRSDDRDPYVLEPGALEYVCSWIRDGHTISDLVEQAILVTNLPLKGHHLRSLLDATYGRDNVSTALYDAREDGATALAEESLHIADNVLPDKDHVAKARLRIDQRNWLAERYNRRQFGQRPDVAITAQINIANLHKSALNAPPPPNPHLILPPGATIVPDEPALPPGGDAP
jgi:hypothetical protein